MKRNNWFMMAYIAFIILCALIHHVYPIPSWEKMVSAITVSSAFFALADPFLVLANAMSRVVRSLDIYCKESLNSIKEEKTELKKVATVLEESNIVSPHLENSKQAVYEVLSLTSELEESLNETIQLSQEGKKLTKRETRAGAILTITGFFLFFCIMTFSAVSSIAIRLQDTITVLAFALILISQFFQEGLSDQVENIIEKHQHTVAKHNNLHNSIMQLKETTLSCISNLEDTANSN